MSSLRFRYDGRNLEATNVVIDPEGQVRCDGISLKVAVEAVLAGRQQR